MGMLNENDKVLKWKYIPKNISIIVGGETINIPNERLASFSIEENFEEFYFPLFKITLVIESRLYYKIMAKKNESKIVLRIDKQYKVHNESERSMCRYWINDSFDIITDEGTDDMMSAMKEAENQYKYDTIKKQYNSDLLTDTDNKISFYLFKSTINGTKKNVNKILCNVNVSDAIAYILGVGGINNVVMAQPDNIKMYETFLIPPMSILKALEFIDLYYGIYKASTLIWYGLEYTYIIPYSGDCSVYAADEARTVNIIIPKSNEIKYEKALGNLRKSDNTNVYIVADYKSLGIENQSISNNYVNANDIFAIDEYDANIKSGKSTAINKGGSVTKIFKDKTENPLLAEMYTAQTNAMTAVISVHLENIDVSPFTPNKKFNMMFEDSNYTAKYNGNYFLAGISHSFTREGEDFGVSSTAVLKKTK